MHFVSSILTGQLYTDAKETIIKISKIFLISTLIQQDIKNSNLFSKHLSWPHSKTEVKPMKNFRNWLRLNRKSSSLKIKLKE